MVDGHFVGVTVVISHRQPIDPLTRKNPLYGFFMRKGLVGRSGGHGLHAARLNDACAETETGAEERGARDLTHADQHHAVTGLLADGPIGRDELCLAAREAKQLRSRHDVFVKPR